MTRFDRVLQRIRARKVAQYIKRGARVLDVGCADGELLRTVPWIGSYVGIDPDAPYAATGGAKFLRTTFPTPLLSGEDRFDVITGLAVLEHIPTEAQPNFARACARHLVPGGCLVMTVPSSLVDPILEVLIRMRLLDGMETEQHYGFDPNQTPSMFEPHGLRLRRHQRFELGLNHLFAFERVS